LINDNGHYFYNIYPGFLTEITLEILKDKDVIQESEIFELNQIYAKCVFEKVSRDRSDDIIKYMRAFDFDDLRKITDIIKDDSAYKNDIYVETDECKNLLVELKNIKSEPGNRWKHKSEIQRIFRILNNYKISISNKKYALVYSDLNRIESFEIESLPLTSVDGRELYNENDGIVIEINQITIMT
jgi:CRISPR-associated endonuclease/helicase Cas3